MVLKIRTKKNITSNKIENTNTKRIVFIYNDNKEENVEGKWKYILLSGIINLIQSIFFAYSLDIKTNAWIWYFLITSIFYYLIFKVKLYRHHYLSIVLNIIFWLIIDLLTENLQNDTCNKTLVVLHKYLKEIFYSSSNVVAKYVMEKKYVSVYEFSFHVGIINLILLNYICYFWALFYSFEWSWWIFKNFNSDELLLIFGVIFTHLGINLTTLFTTKFNSPCHVIIIFVFGQIAYYLDFKGTDIPVIFLLIIIVFLSLIFNEFIEIKFFGL